MASEQSYHTMYNMIALMLIAKSEGHYHFLKGIDPYSCGVIADPGWEIVHVTLEQALPWREGFDRVEAHLQEVGRDRQALCGMELRSPAPFTMAGFIAFNRDYCRVLKAWDLYVGELNPVARTNVAPLFDPPGEPVLHAFSYTVPALVDTSRTLVIAGAGELREGYYWSRVLSVAGIPVQKPCGRRLVMWWMLWQSVCSAWGDHGR